MTMRKRLTHAYDLRRRVLLEAKWFVTNLSGYKCSRCGSLVTGWYWARHRGNGYEVICGNLLGDCYPAPGQLRSAIRSVANGLEVHESVVAERALLKGTTRRLERRLDALHEGPEMARTHGEVRINVN